MPVDDKSLDYQAQAPAWAKVRALRAGEDTAKATLVKRLPGHSDKTFASFTERAYLYPAMTRAIEAFGGLIFYRSPKVEAPDYLAPYIKDATLDGVSLEALASECVNEVLEVSRFAVLVDHPPTPTTDGPMTRATAERLGLRAFARIYKTEDILFVRRERVGGVVRVTQVRLAEAFETVDPTDRYKTIYQPAVRVLELIDGAYVYSLHVRDEAGKWSVVEDGRPMRANAPISYIPIIFGSHVDMGHVARRPPLADMADVNASHLNTSALNEWGEMWVANPTPIFKGIAAPPVDEDGEPLEANALRLGPEEAQILSPDGDAFFMEFEGKGMESLRATMKAKEDHMARIGARILADDPRQAIAAETAKIQNGAEHSMLARIAGIVSEVLSAVMNEFSLWETGSELKPGQRIDLNRDLTAPGIEPAMLKELVAAWMNGAITMPDLFARLQKAEIVRPGKTIEEHQDELELEAPPEVTGAPTS